MSGGIDLRLETLSVLGFDEPSDAGGARKVLSEALALLAARLSRSPLARASLRAIALERLELGGLSAEELAGPSGAERLADELYSTLSRMLA